MNLLGQTRAVAMLREQILRIVERTSRASRVPPILLQGETGTGKNLVAHLIHQSGPRSRGPFVDVNCAAIPEGLLEAELFGFERGAFTDARQPKAGLFQSANGGTILLDEISLLSDALQAKLLTVIEERMVRRLGSTRPESIDVSIIAATNEDLSAAVRAHRFRHDLYHRLAVVTVCVPSLRDRTDDIPLLAEHFLDRACQDYGLPRKVLTPAAQATLSAYPWPGNVRELANAMERVALLTETSRIAPEMLALPVESTAIDSRAAGPDTPKTSLGARIGAWEREELRGALEATRWNVARAAARLGITRGTIRYRIAKYDLAPSSRRARRSSLAAPARRPAVPATSTARREPRLVALLETAVATLEAEGAADLGRDFDIVVEKIESFAGRIEDAGPSRIVAVFGLDPVEDAPQRAALAGMAIQNALERGRQSQRRRAVVATAIHAAHCPVGDVSGRAQIEADTKRRMAMVLEDLRAGAGPDTVVVSAAARSFLGRRFDFDDSARPDEPPIQGHRLLDYHPQRFGVGGHPGLFVGRDRELGVLQTRWREVREGRGQLVALIGEPGIGKSRLLFEFRRALGSEPFTYLEGRGESYGSAVPYLPAIDLLKGWFRIDERDDPLATADRVTARLHALDQTLAADASPLLVLLGAPAADPNWPGLEPAQRRQRTLDALTRLVLRLSQAQPVVLAVEDLHWIDTETQAFLDRLVASVHTARLLVLVSYRPEFTHLEASQSPSTRLRLDPLESASAEALAQSLVGDSVALKALTQRLVERTQGNPFFLEESIRTLIETGVLRGERGAYRQAQELHALDVPPTVHAVLAARIDRLPPEDKELLQVAAIVGKDVPFALMRAIADVPEATLRRGLTNLQEADLLRDTQGFPEVEYTFKHALTHETAYGALPPDRRRMLHTRILEALEDRYAARLGDQVERLAYHALAAESWPRALAYCRQAGAKAAWRSAHREAVRHFEHALQTIHHLPDTRTTREETLDIHLQLRWSLVPLGEYARLAGSLRDAQALAERLDDPLRLAEICQSMTNYLRLVGNCDGALIAGQRAHAIGAALGHHVLQIRATYQLGMVYAQRGDYAGAIRAYQTVVDFLRGELMYERFGEPSVLSVHARAWLATSLAEVGRFTTAISIGEEALQIAETARNAFSLSSAHIGLGTACADQGDLGRAIPLLERGVALCRDGSFHPLLRAAASALGAALARAGRIEEALPLLQLAVDVATSKGLIGGSSLRLARLGEAMLLAGRTDEGRTLASDALDSARTYKEQACEARALYLLGNVAAEHAPSDFQVAAEHYAAAMVIAESLSMRPLVAKCHGRLGKLYRRLGQPDRAREHVIQTVAMLREMDMRFPLEQAEAELRKTE